MRFRIITTERSRSDVAARVRPRQHFPKTGSPERIRLWPSTGCSFLDTFRYLDQLGRLARAGVQVVMHNTLAASDYGLLNEKTLAPRPNYWGALLWRQLMGSTVLDSGVPIKMGLHVYAHCQRETSGGVSLLIINTDRNAPHSLMLPTTSERYTLGAVSLRDTTVRLNGR